MRKFAPPGCFSQRHCLRAPQTMRVFAMVEIRIVWGALKQRLGAPALPGPSKTSDPADSKPSDPGAPPSPRSSKASDLATPLYLKTS